MRRAAKDLDYLLTGLLVLPFLVWMFDASWRTKSPVVDGDGEILIIGDYIKAWKALLIIMIFNLGLPITYT